MSKTIESKNSKVKYYTNISSERLIGNLCRDVNAKHYYYKHKNLNSPLADTYIDIDMALDMTKEECIDTSKKLKQLIPSKIFGKYSHYFRKGSTSKDLKLFINEFVKFLEICDGYECIG